MPGKTVRFADPSLYTPSPSWSDVSLPSTAGPITPPPVNLVLPEGIYHLHPILLASETLRVDYDVSLPSSTASIPNTSPSMTASVLSQPATNPPLPYLEIVTPQLPWKLFVWPAVRGSPYVTVSDVLLGIYQNLRTAVTQNEFAQAGSERVSDTFWKRCRRGASKETEAIEINKGVKRIDFLEGRNAFQGLLHTKQPHVFRMDTTG